MALAKVAPATEAMQVDDHDPVMDSENEDDNGNRGQLKKKLSKPFSKHYSNRGVNDELHRLEEKVRKLKSENKTYKNNIKWILNIIRSTVDNVVIGEGNVVVVNEKGDQEDIKEIMAKHFAKVTCEHADISNKLAKLKKTIEMSSLSLKPCMSSKHDEKLDNVLQLLEMALQPDTDVTKEIEKALVAIQKWTAKSKLPLTEMYKVKCNQAPKEAMSAIQFVSSKCVDAHSREELKKLLDIDCHIMEDNPNDQNMCFRGLIFWRQKNTEKNNAKQLQELLKELDKSMLAERKKASKSILKLNSADLNMMDGGGEQNANSMNKNVEEILAHVKSISLKLATTERRELLPILQPGASAVDQPGENPAEVQKRARSISVEPPSSPKRSRTRKVKGDIKEV